MRSILAGIDEGRSLFILIGDRGSGKTELLARIGAELSESVRTILLQCQTKNTPVNVPESILAALGVLASKPGRTELVNKLRDLGLQQRSSGRGIVLLLDDASNLDEESLKAFLELLMLVNSRGTVLQLVLSGEATLRSRVLSLKKSIDSLPEAALYEVIPLPADEIDEYIEGRIRAAGEIETAIFSRAACAKIAKLSGGVPALIDELCEKALEEACRRSRTLIDCELIEDAALKNSLLEDAAKNRGAPAASPTLDDSNRALVAGEPDPSGLQTFIVKHRRVLAGAGAVALSLLIGAAIRDLNSSGFHFSAHNQELMTAGDRPSVKQPEAPQMRVRVEQAVEKSSATVVPNNSSGITAAGKSVHAWSTEESPQAPELGQIVNDEPVKQPTQSILSQRLLEDGARLLSTRNYDDAIKTYQTALAYDPKNRDLLEAISRANKAKGEEKQPTREASSDATVLGSDPKLRQNSQKRELESNQQSTAESSNEVEKALQVGRKFLALGEYDEAVKVLRSGLSIDPKSEPLRAELARARLAASTEEQVLGSP